MNGEQMPEWYFAYTQDALNLHILCMFKGTFSLDVAHVSKFNLILECGCLKYFICVFVLSSEKLQIFKLKHNTLTSLPLQYSYG